MPGVEQAELRLAGSGEAWRTRVVLVRADPRRVRLSLAAAVAAAPRRGAWTVDSAPAHAALAVNAGQFRGATPWGWVVHEGREHRAPGQGPLAPAVVVDSAGRVALVPADRIDTVRAAHAAALARGAPAPVREAFQSYPALLADGQVPGALCAPGRGVDLTHRDARLALGVLPDGRVLLALTRFDALGGALGAVPFGPTVPEAAALMGALGARDAVLLDGGISAQLLVRDPAAPDAPRRWPGLRAVPLGLVATPR
jgi:exopolysaccharide biosynthesis protein